MTALDARATATSVSRSDVPHEQPVRGLRLSRSSFTSRTARSDRPQLERKPASSFGLQGPSVGERMARRRAASRIELEQLLAIDSTDFLTRL